MLLLFPWSIEQTESWALLHPPLELILAATCSQEQILLLLDHIILRDSVTKLFITDIFPFHQLNSYEPFNNLLSNFALKFFKLTLYLLKIWQPRERHRNKNLTYSISIRFKKTPKSVTLHVARYYLRTCMAVFPPPRSQMTAWCSRASRCSCRARCSPLNTTRGHNTWS